jgi:hypothetical protein
MLDSSAPQRLAQDGGAYLLEIFRIIGLIF